MSLEEKLKTIREGSAKRMPPEALALIHRVTDDLRDSGITDRVPGIGQIAPSFDLADSRGQQVSLSGILEKGPAVVTFFRGHW